VGEGRPVLHLQCFHGGGERVYASKFHDFGTTGDDVIMEEQETKHEAMNQRKNKKFERNSSGSDHGGTTLTRGGSGGRNRRPGWNNADPRRHRGKSR
jgi:hypothetical protein